ncbi:MAG TPA: DUF4365 domain-containing protein [Streptosporangiaceae bacterium]|nr:DUF4365 domain-containing protein [Streptosporangiaceae bacterium]
MTSAFERLGWGTVENTRHDVGTDLYVCARDERLFDLGLLVGVQVKTGETTGAEGTRTFREAVRDPGGDVTGWWFRDDDRSHVDAWLSHGLPHLIVLHDLTSRTSYWEHITSETVVPTGKGAKVFVLKTNTIDDGHRDALLRVAATVRPGVAWEGSAWIGAASVLPRDLMRHALVAPRLVAPHPNLGHDVALSPEQAIALLVQARVADLGHFVEKRVEAPALGEGADSPEWARRFVSALGRRVTTGDCEPLLQVVVDAPSAADCVAATVTAAASLLEEGRADEAITLLETALARDDAAPVDHAWLTLQHARACSEVGRLDEARASAVSVQKSLARLVATGHGMALGVNSLRRSLHDPGTQVPAAVVNALNNSPGRRPEADELLSSLRGHISAKVRTAAAKALHR